MKKKGSKSYYCRNKKCTSIFKSSSDHLEHAAQLEKIPSALSDEFLFNKKLGAGANGVVFQIYDPFEEENKAIKIIKVDDPEEMKKELKILLNLHHQSVVRYFRSGILKNSKVFIIMEECDSNLIEYLEENKASLTHDNKVSLFLKICKGLNYIHHHKNGEIVHRDLKPANILMKDNEVRLSDFGESKMGNKSKSTFKRGTPLYMPPELQSLDDDTKIIASPKHDIWSLGIILHQMFANSQHPFKIPDSSDSWLKNVMVGKYFIDQKYILEDSQIAIVIRGCLQHEPANRFGIRDILNLFSIKKFPPIILKPTISSQEEIKLNDEVIGKEQVVVAKEHPLKKLDNQVADKQNDIHLDNVEGNQVELLHANENLLTPERQKEFEKRLSQAEGSSSLYLSGFELGKGTLENAQRIAQLLETNKTITDLYLDRNDLGQGNPKNIEVFAHAIKENKIITYLVLNSNGFGKGNPKNIAVLAQVIIENKTITYLGLENNGLENSLKEHPLLEAKSIVDARG